LRRAPAIGHAARTKSAAWPMVSVPGHTYGAAMDIIVLAITVIAALLLTRTKALVVAAAAWIAGLSLVAWGPAHNSDVHIDSAGFWVPWAVVLAICVLVVVGIDRFRRRAAAPRLGRAR
jgi:hypothetical protein